jgi:hypothetical protein
MMPRTSFTWYPTISSELARLVGANRLTAKHKGKKVKGFKPTSFECDKDTFTFREKD